MSRRRVFPTAPPPRVNRGQYTSTWEQLADALIGAIKDGAPAAFDAALARRQRLHPDDYKFSLAAALCYCAERGDEHWLSRVLAAGADPDAPDPSGRLLRTNTPLARAAEGGHTACIRRLLAAGADVDAYVTADTVPHFATALHAAASAGQIRSVRALLAGGAALTPGPDDVDSPETIAASRGHTHIAELLQAQARRDSLSATFKAPGEAPEGGGPTL